MTDDVHVFTEADLLPIPRHLRPGLIAWLNQGVKPGGFLTAVITNDLHGAIARADEISREHIRAIVEYLYETAPKGSIGSNKVLEQWPLFLRARERQGEATKLHPEGIFPGVVLAFPNDQRVSSTGKPYITVLVQLKAGNVHITLGEHSIRPVRGWPAVGETVQVKIKHVEINNQLHILPSFYFGETL